MAEEPAIQPDPASLRQGKHSPAFEQQFGLAREVRFIHKVDPATGNFLRDQNGNKISDGGVHQLWTVKGTQGDQTIACPYVALYLN